MNLTEEELEKIAIDRLYRGCLLLTTVDDYIGNGLQIFSIAGNTPTVEKYKKFLESRQQFIDELKPIFEAHGIKLNILTTKEEIKKFLIEEGLKIKT